MFIRKLMKIIAEECLTQRNIKEISKYTTIEINNRKLSNEEIEKLIISIKNDFLNNEFNYNKTNINEKVNIRYENNHNNPKQIK